MNNTPRQTKLLGATVASPAFGTRGLGVIVAVSSTLTFGYAIVEGEGRVNHRVALAELKRDEVVFPAQPQPYRTQTERVGVGTWDEVHALIPTQAVVLAVAA